MAEESKERKFCDVLLIVLLFFYALFGVSIITYGVIQHHEGAKAGLEPMMIALGLNKQAQLYYSTGAFSALTSICFIFALCLSPKWGCWYLLGCVFLIISIALNIYLICILLISLQYNWGAQDYLWNLRYSDPEGKMLWDNLQMHYECCGVMDEDEWDIKPESCPNFVEDDNQIHGCVFKFVHDRKPKTIGMIVIIFTITILEILGLIAVYFILWPYFLQERGDWEEEETEEEGEEEGEEELEHPHSEHLQSILEGNRQSQTVS